MAGCRSRIAALIVVPLCSVWTAACGSGDDSAGTGGQAEPAITLSGAGTTVPAGGKAAPRWETIVTLSGQGADRPAAFTVLPDAIQWRARWSCETGMLRVTTDPAPRRPGPLIEGTCPQTGDGFAISTGPIRLAIEASGPWKLVVDQQLDTPLAEAPPPGLTSARVLSEGNFYSVEKEGRGRARLYQLPDGARALRFEGFEVSTNTDLFVWLIDAAKPSTTVQVLAANRWVLGNLKSTVGEQNYVIPPDVPVERVRSIVIWCEPVRVAYAAAALSPP